MAYVGTAAAGKVLTATGDTAGSTFSSLGVNSGLTANGVVISQNNAAFTATGSGAAGQILTSNGPGVDPSFQAATSGLFHWNDQTIDVTMTPNNGYTTSSPFLVTLTLPSPCPYGSIFKIVGNGNGGWLIAQQAGQTINFGLISTTTGVSGFLQSISSFDAIEILCSTADVGFTVINGPQGNITYN